MTTSLSKQEPEFGTLASGGYDRLIQVLRGVSMSLVVIAHIGFSVIKPNGLGFQKVADGWGIDLLSWSIAWVAAFFAVGGALSRNADKVPITRWWARRAPRLLLPYYAWAAILLPISVILAVTQPAGLCTNFDIKDVVKFAFPPGGDCLGLMAAPMWFLMVFIPLALFAPWLARLYDSRLRFVLPIAALAVLLVLDVGVATGTSSSIPLIGTAHLYLFWALSYYLGFFYADGYLDNLGNKLLGAAIGLGALAAVMMIVGPWPGNVFGGWKNGGNQFPPTLAWMSGALAGMLFIIWARRPIERFSMRRGIRSALDWLADRSLTILVWHMAPATVLFWFFRSTGLLPSIEAIPDLFERLLWLALVTALLVPLVNLFYPVELIGDRVGKDLERRYKARVERRGLHDAQPQPSPQTSSVEASS